MNTHIKKRGQRKATLERKGRQNAETKIKKERVAKERNHASMMILARRRCLQMLKAHEEI